MGSCQMLFMILLPIQMMKTSSLELVGSSYKNIIDNGYMPFIAIPLSFYTPNSKSDLRNSRFISQAISKLLKKQLRRRIRSKTLLLKSPNSR